MRTKFTKEYRIERAKKDLTKKLSVEYAMATDIKSFLRGIYNDYIKCPSLFCVYDYKDTLVIILKKHYQRTKKKFYNDFRLEHKSSYPLLTQLESKCLNNTINNKVDEFIEPQATKQADLILKATEKEIDKNKDKITKLVLALYAIAGVDATEDLAELDIQKVVDKLIGTRAERIATVEVQELAEITKLTEAQELASIAKRERAGELTESQAESSERTAGHTSEQTEDFITATAESDDPKAMLKEWNAILDSRTRETHAELDGEVVGLDEYFDVGGYPMLYCGDKSVAPPEEFMNCRCFNDYYPAED